MNTIRKICEWILKNKKRVFSSIGVALSLLFFIIHLNSKENTNDIDDPPKEMNNIEVSGDVNGNIYQNSTIYNMNEDTEKE